MYILSSNYDIGKDWLMTGFARILVIIAILQLVKKIPDIINTIFGTKIQSKGGIKGRLGEMAGIGGVAQKAWTSLGNGAKNLAKLGLAVPAAGAGALANKLYKMDTGKSLLDTKAVRKARGIGAAASSAWKTGSPVKAVKAYNEGEKAPSYTTNERMKARNIASQNIRNQVGTDLFDSSGNVNNSFVDKKGNSGFVSAGILNNANKDMYNILEKKYGQAGKEKARQMRAQELKTGIEGMTSKQNAAMESLNNFATFASRTKAKFKYKVNGNDIEVSAADKANTIANKIRDGKSFDELDYEFLRAFATDSNISDATTAYKKLQNESMALKTRFGSQYNGSTSSVDLGILAGKQDGIINDAKQKFDIAKEKMSVVDQDSMTFIETALNNSFKTLNGAYQNNGSVIPMFGIKETVKDPSGNIIIDPKTNQPEMEPKYENLVYDKDGKDGKKFVNGETGKEIEPDKGIVDYINLLREGIVTTSAEDYFGNACSNEEVASFNEASKVATDFADKEAKDNGREVDLSDYYKKLHEQLKNTNPSNANVRKNIDRIEKSNVVPIKKDENKK